MPEEERVFYFKGRVHAASTGQIFQSLRGVLNTFDCMKTKPGGPKQITFKCVQCQTPVILSRYDLFQLHIWLAICE